MTLLDHKIKYKKDTGKFIFDLKSYIYIIESLPLSVNESLYLD